MNSEKEINQIDDIYDIYDESFYHKTKSFIKSFHKYQQNFCMATFESIFRHNSVEDTEEILNEINRLFDKQIKDSQVFYEALCEKMTLDELNDIINELKNES